MLLRKIIFFSLPFLFSYAAFCQAVRKPVSAAYPGLGAYSLNHVDVFSLTSNPASLSAMNEPVAGVFSENRFMLSETQMFSSIVAIPSKDGNFAFEADYFGYKNFNETELGVAYARNAGKKVDLGIKFNYYSFRIPGFESPSTFNFELGIICHVTEQFHAGLHFYNPVGGRLSKTEDDKLSSVYTFGLGYEASENFYLSGEFVKTQDVSPFLNAAMQYRFEKRFFARFGFTTESNTPFGGAGVSWQNIRLDVSASYHPQFGISPGLMLILNLNKKKIETQ